MLHLTLESSFPFHQNFHMRTYKYVEYIHTCRYLNRHRLTHHAAPHPGIIVSLPPKHLHTYLQICRYFTLCIHTCRYLILYIHVGSSFPFHQNIYIRTYKYVDILCIHTCRYLILYIHVGSSFSFHQKGYLCTSHTHM